MERFPLSHDQLIQIQGKQRQNADAMDLLWEIRRLKNVLRQADELRKIIEQGWREESNKHLTALHQLKVLLSNEQTN